MADKPKILGEAAFRKMCVNDREWLRILDEGLAAVESMDKDALMAAVRALAAREAKLKGGEHAG
ncbi:hypothetical protein HFU84_13105 [Acidithiobacillus sp. CV18-2]|nr:hypothetical protein [Acidithiobacillus sp. CV18-3]MBU2758459.1 hypothetical protein [Acidithiobacillus sp. BN09-2]MBU2778415.1 hypothetical protein [Acidithiobacillus sp. CV18-2]MBU2798241.1 hypothetical protein [Acidithiobacillus sp. VAN18-4]